MEKVSILIPVFNMEKYLAQTIESALGQTYKNIEIIVINDGSSDRSSEIAQSFKDSITYFYQDNKGLCHALNSGLRIAQGDYIALLDHDDVLMPKKIEKQIEVFRRNPEYGLVFTNGVRIDGAGQIIKESFYCDDVPEGRVFKELFLRMFVSGPTMMFPKRVLDVVGNFDTACLVQDYQMALKIAYHYPIGFLDEKLYAHRWHGANTSANGYVMCNNELMTLLTVIERFPDVVRVVGRKVFRKRMSGVYYRAARGEMTEKRNYRKANSFLLNSLKHKLSFRTSFALIGSLFGVDLISALKGIRMNTQNSRLVQ